MREGHLEECDWAEEEVAYGLWAFPHSSQFLAVFNVTSGNILYTYSTPAFKVEFHGA